MTFGDWLADTRRRYRQQPPARATATAAAKLWRGVVRRTADPHIGRPIWARDGWDVCVVADAARLDLMRTAIDEYAALPDGEEVRGVWSNASCSMDWIDRTFNDHPADAARTGYVTANPFTAHDAAGVPSADLAEPRVGHLRRLYDSDWQETEGCMTVPPATVTDHAIDAWRRRDDLGIDRLVVHYMQPHEPFRARPEWGGGDHALLEDMVTGDADHAGASIYPQVRRGEVPLSLFKSVYLDNHHWVLEDIADRLVDNIAGDIAITADHGNALGEWGAWHHPPAMVAPPVRRVPWATVTGTDEETVTPDLRAGGIDASTKGQLEALGYR